MSCIIETFNLTKRYPQIKRYREILIHPFQRRENTAIDKVNIAVEATTTPVCPQTSL